MINNIVALALVSVVVMGPQLYMYHNSEDYIARCRYDVRKKSVSEYTFRGWAYLNKNRSNNYILIDSILKVEEEIINNDELRQNMIPIYENRYKEIKYKYYLVDNIYYYVFRCY